MGEIFVIYGNPFSRKRCSKNLFQVLCVPYYKRVNFTSKKKKDSSGYMNKIKDSFFLMGRNNSKVNLCNNSSSSHNTNTNIITNINITIRKSSVFTKSNKLSIPHTPLF